MEHFKRNKIIYLFSIISFLIGIVVGIVLSVSDFKYISLLTPENKTIIDYITGTAGYSELFHSRLASIMMCLLIVFVLNLTIFTSFLSFLFIGYQSCLFILTSAAIISANGFVGVLNVIFIAIPINLINLFIMIVLNVLSVRRAKDKQVLGFKFFESFKENYYLGCCLVCVFATIMVCVFHSFLLPLLIKSFMVINY